MSLPTSFSKFLYWSHSLLLCLSFLIWETGEGPPPLRGSGACMRARGQALPCPQMEVLAGLLTHPASVSPSVKRDRNRIYCLAPVMS